MQLNYCLTQYINRLKEGYFKHLIKRELKNKAIHSHILKSRNINIKHHNHKFKIDSSIIKILGKQYKNTGNFVHFVNQNINISKHKNSIKFNIPYFIKVEHNNFNLLKCSVIKSTNV